MSRSKSQINSIVEIKELTSNVTEIFPLMNFLIPVGEYTFKEFTPYWVAYLKDREGIDEYENDAWFIHSRQFVSYLLSFCDSNNYHIHVR